MTEKRQNVKITSNLGNVSAAFAFETDTDRDKSRQGIEVNNM